MKSCEYTILTIVVSLLEGAAIVAIVLWLLPHCGITIPVWGLILIMMAFGVYEILTYRLGRKALVRKSMLSPKVGYWGKAATRLAPSGYVKLEGELWRAMSNGPNIAQDDNIIVVGVKGLTLFVAPQHLKEMW